MKAQGCRFKRKNNSNYEVGIAFLKIFGYSSVDFIVDVNGQVVSDEDADYELMTGPMCHMDSEFWSVKK